MAHRLAPESETELDDIWLYIAKRSGSMDIADRLVDSITGGSIWLSRNSFIGRSRDEDLCSGLRSFSVGEYVILYRIEDGDVVILHIVRGSRDIQALFSR